MWGMHTGEVPRTMLVGAGRSTCRVAHLIGTGQKSGQQPLEEREVRISEVAARAVWFTHTGKEN